MRSLSGTIRSRQPLLIGHDKPNPYRPSKWILKVGIHLTPSIRFRASSRERQEFWQSFYVTCNKLYLEVLSALALGFGLQEKFIEKLCNNGDNTLKMIHYPPVSTRLKGVRMMAHTGLEILPCYCRMRRGDWNLRTLLGKGFGRLLSQGYVHHLTLYLI